MFNLNFTTRYHFARYLANNTEKLEITVQYFIAKWAGILKTIPTAKWDCPISKRPWLSRWSITLSLFHISSTKLPHHYRSEHSMRMRQLFCDCYYFRSNMATEHVVVIFGLKVDYAFYSFEDTNENQRNRRSIEKSCGFTNNKGSHVS